MKIARLALLFLFLSFPAVASEKPALQYQNGTKMEELRLLLNSFWWRGIQGFSLWSVYKGEDYLGLIYTIRIKE
jgi:hypothetical protein